MDRNLFYLAVLLVIPATFQDQAVVLSAKDSHKSSSTHFPAALLQKNPVLQPTVPENIFKSTATDIQNRFRQSPPPPGTEPARSPPGLSARPADNDRWQRLLDQLPGEITSLEDSIVIAESTGTAPSDEIQRAKEQLSDWLELKELLEQTLPAQH